MVMGGNAPLSHLAYRHTYGNYAEGGNGKVEIKADYVASARKQSCGTGIQSLPKKVCRNGRIGFSERHAGILHKGAEGIAVVPLQKGYELPFTTADMGIESAAIM